MRCRPALALAVGSLALLGTVNQTHATETCLQPWAEIGEYRIEGNFRGQLERATAHLSRSCRVTIQLPGVFTGGPVKARNGCLEFTFKVQDVPETFVATWCGAYAVVPWKGQDMKVTVYRVRTPEPKSW